MTPQQRNDYSELNTIIQNVVIPLQAQLKELSSKVDKLNEDRVTRSDIEKLTISFVSKEYYSTRHDQLIGRDMDLEKMVRDVQMHMDTEFQKFEEKLKQAHEARLSEKDQAWLNVNRWLGVVAIVLTILSFLVQHVKIN